MRLNWNGVGLHISRPSQPLALVGLKTHPFGLHFIEGVIGGVLCLGWIQIGLRLWPKNNVGPKSPEELEKWAEQYIEERC